MSTYELSEGALQVISIFVLTLFVRHGSYNIFHDSCQLFKPGVQAINHAI